MVGIYIRKKFPISLKPSSLAASMISCGKEPEALTEHHNHKRVEIEGSIKCCHRVDHFNCENIRNIRIMIAANRIIIAVRAR